MNVGNLNFINQLKIVSVDLKRNPVEYGTFESGKICGSSANRKPQVKKDKGFKYMLPDNLESEPIYYKHKYQSRVLVVSEESVNVFSWHLKDKINFKKRDRFIDGVRVEGDISDLQPVLRVAPKLYKHLYELKVTTEIVKKTKTVWELIEPVYFYWDKMPEILEDTLIAVDKPKAVPYEDREYKYMSHRTRSKIQSKLLQWHGSVVEKNKAVPEKVNFYFLTFTVPTRGFSHELTVKAWANFVKNMGRNAQASKKVFNFLWVAELQSGKRSADRAADYFKMFQKGGEYASYYKQKYDQFTERALNPTGNIHYHMIVDRFYDVKELNELWLTCLENQGCSRYTSTGALAHPVQADKIKSSYSGISRYMAKYVSKNEGELKCQLWHCSRPISKLATSLADCYIELAKIKVYVDRIQESSLTLC